MAIVEAYDAKRVFLLRAQIVNQSVHIPVISMVHSRILSNVVKMFHHQFPDNIVAHHQAHQIIKMTLIQVFQAIELQRMNCTLNQNTEE